MQVSLWLQAMMVKAIPSGICHVNHKGHHPSLFIHMHLWMSIANRPDTSMPLLNFFATLKPPPSRPTLSRLTPVISKSQYWLKYTRMLTTSILLLGSPLSAHALSLNVLEPIVRVLMPAYNNSHSLSDNDSQQGSVASSSTNSGMSNSSSRPEYSSSLHPKSQPPSSPPRSKNATTPDRTSPQAAQTTSFLSANSSDHHPAAAQLFTQANSAAITTTQPSLYELMDAEFAVSRGEVQRGLKTYKQQSFKGDATAVFERALSLSLQSEQPQSSLDFAYQWQQQNPDHVPAWFYVAHLALKANDYALAGETLSRILDYDPRADLSQILTGIYPKDSRNQRELLTILQQLNSEQNPALSVLQAGLLLQFNEPEAALMHIERALSAQPDNVPYITLKADILRQTSSPDGVIAYIDAQRQRLADSKSLYLYQIRYLLEQQMSQSAWQLLLDAHQRFADDAEITLLAALVGLDIGEYTSADKLLAELEKLAPYQDQAYYYLGISAERQQHYPQARRYFSQVMQEDLVLQARKKVIAFALLDNDANAAFVTLQQLRAQFPVHTADSYVLQADIMRQQGNMTAANELLARISRQYPNHEGLLFARVQLLDDQQDYVVKRTLLQHLISLSPDDSSYQLGYAKLLLAHNPDDTQGLAIASNVLAIPFDDRSYDSGLHLQALEVLADNALRQGRYQSVVDYLQTPYEVLPTLSSGILLLRAYQGLEDTDKVNALLDDIQQRFGTGKQDISDLIQQY